MSDSLRSLHIGIDFDDGLTKAIGRIDGKMDDLERGFIKFGTKVDKSERGLKDMGITGKRAGLQVAEGLQRSEKEAGDFNRELRNSGSALGGIKKAALGLGGIIAGAFAVDKVKDFVVSGIQLSADKEAINSQFGQIFGGLEQTASKSLNAVAEETGILPERLKGSYTQIAAFTKTTGADTAQAMSLAERATLAAADAAAFNNSKIEDVTGSMQSFLKGKVVAPC